MGDRYDTNNISIETEYECVRESPQWNAPMSLIQLLSESGQFDEHPSDALGLYYEFSAQPGTSRS